MPACSVSISNETSLFSAYTAELGSPTPIVLLPRLVVISGLTILHFEASGLVGEGASSVHAKTLFIRQETSKV